MAIGMKAKKASPGRERVAAAACQGANGTVASDVATGQLEPIIELAEKAFHHELPELLRLRNARRQWVAYEGSRRLCFGATKHDLYKKCLRQGVERGNLYVRSIAPATEQQVEILFNI